MAKILKRAIDIAAASLGLVLLAPLFALLGAAVRAGSPGPVFFRQRRLGRNGVPFTIWKFRTMHENAADLRNADGSAVCLQDDARVTSLGAWLRNASLDELPQLWNVLAGDMSLVGPRPDQADQLAYYTPRERAKLAMRPGITGLAQIAGRNRISWRERKEIDAQYAERWSLALDFAILLKTIPYVLLRRDINEVHANGGSSNPAAHRN